MKQINSFLFAVLGILLLTACDNHGLKKTKSGLLYKIISDGKNPVVKRGQFMKLSFSQKIRDSILFSSASGMPAYVRIDSVPSNAYSPMEVFPLLRKGDSAVIVQLGDSIQRKSNQPLPPFIHKKDQIILTMRVDDVYETEAEVQKDKQAAAEVFHTKETKQVEDYLKEHNILATKTAMGTFVQVLTVGDGPLIDSGKQVSVIYTGKAFPTGKVFETNDEAGKQPIKFVIGRRAIIPGWDDGLRLLRKGGTATLYIPAFLAYDAQPGPGKTPNENLIFNVRIVDVSDAPAESALPMPMRPGGPNRSGGPNGQQPPPTHR